VVPRCVQPSSCSATDLVSEESARPHRACCFLDRSCESQPRRGDPIKRTGRISLAGALENRTGRKVMMVVGMRSLEECYRNVRRYAAGVMPMARRNARVKLDSEENWQSSAISRSDARPVAIMTFAPSSRR
jgi:hypothetical protein